MTHFKKKKKTWTQRVVATAQRLSFLLQTRVLRLPQLRRRANFSVPPDPSRWLAWEQDLRALGAAKQRLHFMTFGDGKNFPPEVLADDVRRLGFCDTVQALDLRDLDEDFRAKHWRWMRRHPRGCGYWIWKPHLIARALAALPEGDILIYADAGCIAFADEAQQGDWDALLATIRNSPRRVGAHMPGRMHTLRRFCKSDVLEALGGAALRDKPVFEAGRLILQQSAPVRDLIGRWNGMVAAGRYELFDDTPSQAAEDEDFVAHRHDQAVFSLLLYQSDCEIISWPAGLRIFPARLPRVLLEKIFRSQVGDWISGPDTEDFRAMRTALIRWLRWRRAQGRLPASAEQGLRDLEEASLGARAR